MARMGKKAATSGAVRRLMLPLAAAFALQTHITACAADQPAAAREKSLQPGTVSVLAFELPESFYLDPATRAVLHDTSRKDAGVALRSCPDLQAAPPDQVPGIRQCQTRAFLNTQIYRRFQEKFPVQISGERIGGVATEVFMPRAGVAPENQHRVLINLHGGAFLQGFTSFSRMEAMPVAAVARIKVISVDYAEAPEATYPAGSEDVVSVYRELLHQYKPGEIGIYGCSAGGILTAQAVALLVKRALPVPGAIGMFCGAGGNSMEGDSVLITQALEQRPPDVLHLAYFKGANLDDPLLFPAFAPDLLRGFPPSLLISSTRDHQMSSVVYTHSRLVALGVDAELHVWEGLSHAFFYDPDLPQSDEAFRVIASFFQKHLVR
jgi:monoterpene epsilon-lactone hydrolase